MKLSTMVLLATLTLAGCTRIGPGHVGIEVNMAGSQRGVQDFALKTGWVFYNPASTSIMEYPTFVQTAQWTKDPHEGSSNDESITFTTKDAMIVNADISFSYHLVDSMVPQFYVHFRTDNLRTFTDGFMRNVARDKFNEIGGTYAIEDIMGNNGPFLAAVRNAVQDEVAPFGVSIDQFGLIGAPRPPQNVIDAINLKVQAQQSALQKQNEVAQAEADARKAVATAEGEAKSRIALADGEAKAKIAIASGEATANREIAASITPNIIEWKRLQITQSAVEKWGGNMPSTLAGAGGLLFNIPTK